MDRPTKPSGDPSPTTSGTLREGVDYLVENGLWVFTAQYLEKRGSCCGTGCRHCPYSPKGKPSGRGQV